MKVLNSFLTAKTKYSSISDIGLIKNSNEDRVKIKRLFLYDNEIILFGIADGMGGVSNGEFAAQYILNSFINISENFIKNFFFELDLSLVKEFFSKKFVEFNENLLAKFPDYSAGTTLTSGFFLNNKLYLFHIGDTRCYLIQKNEIRILTEDHSENGYLTKRFGKANNINLDISCYSINNPFSLILTCDGIHNVITKEDILKCFAASSSNEIFLELIVELSKMRKSGDNLSAIAINFKNFKKPILKTSNNFINNLIIQNKNIEDIMGKRFSLKTLITVMFFTLIVLSAGIFLGTKLFNSNMERPPKPFNAEEVKTSSANFSKNKKIIKNSKNQDENWNNSLSENDKDDNGENSYQEPMEEENHKNSNFDGIPVLGIGGKSYITWNVDFKDKKFDNIWEKGTFIIKILKENGNVIDEYSIDFSRNKNKSFKTKIDNFKNLKDNQLYLYSVFLGQSKNDKKIIPLIEKQPFRFNKYWDKPTKFSVISKRTCIKGLYYNLKWSKAHTFDPFKKQPKITYDIKLDNHTVATNHLQTYLKIDTKKYDKNIQLKIIAKTDKGTKQSSSFNLKLLPNERCFSDKIETSLTFGTKTIVGKIKVPSEPSVVTDIKNVIYKPVIYKPGVLNNSYVENFGGNEDITLKIGNNAIKTKIGEKTDLTGYLKENNIYKIKLIIKYKKSGIENKLTHSYHILVNQKNDPPTKLKNLHFKGKKLTLSTNITPDDVLIWDKSHDSDPDPVKHPTKYIVKLTETGQEKLVNKNTLKINNFGLEPNHNYTIEVTPVDGKNPIIKGKSKKIDFETWKSPKKPEIFKIEELKKEEEETGYTFVNGYNIYLNPTNNKFLNVYEITFINKNNEVLNSFQSSKGSILSISFSSEAYEKLRKFRQIKIIAIDKFKAISKPTIITKQLFKQLLKK